MLIRYKTWSDQLLYAALDQIDTKDLEKERPMLFGNILSLLNHVYAMDVVWKSHLLGRDHHFQTRNPDDVPAFNVLRQRQDEINHWYQEFASRLSEHQWENTISFKFIGGGSGSMRVYDILHHVVNHATYHRGHIEGVMYQLSVEPPTTDLSVFLQKEQNR